MLVRPNAAADRERTRSGEHTTIYCTAGVNSTLSGSASLPYLTQIPPQSTNEPKGWGPKSLPHTIAPMARVEHNRSEGEDSFRG